MANTILSRLAPYAAGLHHRIWWFRAMTLGVRLIVLDGTSVLLVRHTYARGWYLPGGGVDRGETSEAAAIRELLEETGIVSAERPLLHGVFRNGRRDHVVCYIVRSFAMRPKIPDREIAEVRFFPLDALPEEATRATRTRLAELASGVVSTDW